MSRSLTFAIAIAGVVANPFGLIERDSCVACNPSGIKTLTTPAFGPDMAVLYPDLVGSVQGITFDRRDALSERGNIPICCASGTQCLLMKGLGIPFCYDKFTTNFFLPDGSYGTIYTGGYSGTDGTQANLITGQFNHTDGTAGNIYPESSPLDTSTMGVPTIYTAQGVGSAIPLSSLGSGIQVEVTTFAGPTTLAAITIDATTVPATTIGGSIIPAQSYAGTTIPARTISSKGLVATITGLAFPAASNSKHGSAGIVTPNNLVEQTMVVLLGVLLGFTIFL